MLHSYGYSDNCPRCAARRARRPAAGLSHSTTCRHRLETRLQQDEQFAEVLRRRDVRHGLAPPGQGPSIAVDIDDPEEPVFAPIPTPATRLKSDRLREMYNRQAARPTTSTAAATAATSVRESEVPTTTATTTAEPQVRNQAEEPSGRPDYDPMPEPLGTPEAYRPEAWDEELDEATTAAEKRSR